MPRKLRSGTKRECGVNGYTAERGAQCISQISRMLKPTISSSGKMLVLHESRMVDCSAGITTERVGREH
jgi:hypothetical protein